MATERTLTFLYSLGEKVHWAAGAQPWDFRWQVIQQRCTISMISVWHEYLLVSPDDPKHAPVWAHEPDLLPWDTRQP